MSTKLTEEDIAAAVAVAVPAAVEATLTHEVQVCRAALSDLDASQSAKQYARGFLAVHDAPWLADRDAGRLSEVTP